MVAFVPTVPPAKAPQGNLFSVGGLQAALSQHPQGVYGDACS
jgi:hypothetical protein